jgi:hypothetical protein
MVDMSEIDGAGLVALPDRSPGPEIEEDQVDP